MNRPLYRPTLRQAIGLAVIAIAALAYGFAMRYGVIQNSAIGIACETSGTSWLCASRRAAIALFQPQLFGIVALGAAVLNLMRPSFIPFAITLRRRRRRHRALQHGAVVACGRRADLQPGAARVRRRLKARTVSVAANHSACQLAGVSFQTMNNAHSTRTAAANVSAGGRSPLSAPPQTTSKRTVRPLPSSAQTESRDSADRTTARAPTAPQAPQARQTTVQASA